jgi:hypothetical protein
VGVHVVTQSRPLVVDIAIGQSRCELPHFLSHAAFLMRDVTCRFAADLADLDFDPGGHLISGRRLVRR